MTVETRGHKREPTFRWLAATLLVVVLVEVVGATVVAVRNDQSFTDVTDAFALTNLAIAACFGGCGALLAWHRPRHPVGWLFALSGVLQGATGVAATALLAVGAADRLSPSTRVAATVFSWAWPWSIGVGFLLALLFFPDGRLPSRRWRPVAVVVVVTGVAFVLGSGTDPASSMVGGRLFPHAGAWDGYGKAGALWAGVAVLHIACMVTVVASLAVRYRRGDEIVRRQLLWLILAGIAVVVVVTPVVLLRVGSVLLLLVVLLVPAAIVTAVLRYNLLDIRLVVSLSVSWAVLSAIVGLLYVGLVGVLGSVLAGPASAVLATAVVALAAHPLRIWLQARVDRLFYGDRSDPRRVFDRVGSGLHGPDGLAALAAAIAASLRLPFVAIRSDGMELAAVGDAPSAIHTVPLVRDGARVGELLVGARRGDHRVARKDRDLLDLIAAPVALAVHATVLAEELRTARARMVSGREEERRRMRRDLHDGLGPLLTGIGFKADAALNYVRVQPAEAVELLGQLRTETADALEDVRRLVYDLRPPVLDDYGLIEALRRQATRLDRGHDGSPLQVHIEAPATLPDLPAAVEVAVYRIATEALVNVVRHSSAGTAAITIQVDELSVHLSVLDDGGPADDVWVRGVGLTSMAERAAELGGTLTAGPANGGSKVVAILPLDLELTMSRDVVLNRAK
ncbi:MAG: histidine kinase [Ornithinibacter sp.]